MATDFTIAPMDPNDLRELVDLHAQFLNYGSGIRAHFEAVLQDPASVAVKAVQNGKIVGLDIYTRGIALSGGHRELCERIRALTGDATVYTGDALLVVPGCRGHKLDERMLRVCRELMAQRGATYVLYELWVHPDGRMPAHRTVQRYESVLELGFYRGFYVDFDHYGYLCPLCGAKCRCSARLYLCRV